MLRKLLLAVLGLVLAVLMQGNAAAHAPAGVVLDAATGEARAPLLPAPAFCGLCLGEEDCAPGQAVAVPPAPAVLGHFDAPPEVVEAIDAASAFTAMDFEYLLRTAALESSFNPELEAVTSTAVGLYQFIEQSWFYMIRETGAEVGLDGLAEMIGVGDKGYEVAEEEIRAEILRLRYDPVLSAVLAGLFTQRNFEALARMIEREPDAGELYLAHVMGASGAAALIRLYEKQPHARANRHFPRAARANRAIFYHRNKKPRSVAEVYDYLTGKYHRIPVYAADNTPWLSAPPVVSVPSVVPVLSAPPPPSVPPVLPSVSPLWHTSGDEVPYAVLRIRAWLYAGNDYAPARA